MERRLLSNIRSFVPDFRRSAVSEAADGWNAVSDNCCTLRLPCSPAAHSENSSPQGKWVRWADGSRRCQQHKGSILWQSNTGESPPKPGVESAEWLKRCGRNECRTGETHQQAGGSAANKPRPRGGAVGAGSSAH